MLPKAWFSRLLLGLLILADLGLALFSLRSWIHLGGSDAMNFSWPAGAVTGLSGLAALANLVLMGKVRRGSNSNWRPVLLATFFTVALLIAAAATWRPLWSN